MDGVGRRGERGGGVAAADAAFDQAVAGAVGVERRRRRGASASAGSPRAGSGVQATGKPSRAGGGAVLEGDERHGFAAEAGDALRRARAGRRRPAMTPKRFAAGDVGGGEDERRPPGGRRPRRRGRRRRSGRAGAASGRPSGRGRRAARGRRRRRRCRRPWRGRRGGGGGAPTAAPAAGGAGAAAAAASHDGGDDLAVAGAAAEDAAEGLADLGFARGSACGRGARWRPSACPGCRCRTAPRRGGGRRLAGATGAVGRRGLRRW